jgi:uncharacterized protein
VGGPVAGVGQRMITGVAKRMAAQFFTAVDAELTGAAAAPAEVAAPAAKPQVGQVFARPAPAVAAPANLRTLAIGAAGGSLLTFLGVAVGWLLGRRR